MNLGEYFKWCDAIVPEVDETQIPSISTTKLCKRDILNEGAKEFCKITKCLPKEKKLNCTSCIASLSISGNIPDFLAMREEGVWHYRSSTSTTWDRLKPITIRELDQEFPNWRSQSNNDNVRNYWQDGNVIGFFYTPTTTLTNGFWVYYYATSSDMTTADHYPFTGTTTEDPRLSPYEKVLLPYYEYRALGILGYKDDAVNKELEFYQLCEKAKVDFNTRRDLAQDSQARVKTGYNKRMFG